MKRAGVIAAAIAVGLGFARSGAFAGAPSTEFTVPVPAPMSSVAIESASTVNNPSSFKPREWGLWLGYDLPWNLAWESRMPQVSTFKSTGVPGVEFDFLGGARAFFKSKWMISWRVGLELSTLERSGPSPLSPVDHLAYQSLYLFNWRLGARWMPADLGSRAILPFVDAAFRPIIFAASRSSLADDRLGLGFAVVGQAGIAIPFEQNFVEVGVHGTLGKLHEGSLAGLGVQAGVRFRM